MTRTTPPPQIHAVARETTDTKMSAPVHAVAQPPVTVEDAIALAAKVAVDTRDKTLVDVMADIAAAYDPGNPAALEQPYLRLHDYLRQMYAAGARPPVDLLKADHALSQSIGGHNRVAELRTAAQPKPPPRQQAAPPPRPTVDPAEKSRREAADRGKVSEMLTRRATVTADLEALRAHPDYRRQLEGANDTQLSEDYLVQRKRIFGKRLVLTRR